MRARLVLSALVVLVGFSVPATAEVNPPVPVSGAGPVIVSGRLLGVDGRPGGGVVELWAWPDDTALEDGDVVPMRLVGRAAVGPDGRFAVGALPDGAVGHIVAAKGGYLNLTLRASGDGGSSEYHFSRYLASGEVTDRLVRHSGGRLAVWGDDRRAWVAGPDEVAPEVEIRLDGPPLPSPTKGQAPRSHEGIPEMCPSVTQQVETIRNVRTLVGELHTPEDTANAFLHYGERADSHISVASRVDGGRWSLSGEHHVDNSDEVTIGPNGVGSEQHLRLLTHFDYGRFVNYYMCDHGPTREWIRPLRWNGASITSRS